MRTAFVKVLTEEARKNKDLYLITADLGFLVLDEFKKNFPQQFINIGISEANLIGVAAGMALMGKTVMTYSAATFVTMRCFEQIRDDVGSQNLNVKIVGIGCGLSYGLDDLTHMAVEDMAIMKTIPHMTVLSPGTPREAGVLSRQMFSHKGPCYMRLTKGGEGEIYDNKKAREITIGKGVILQKGKKIAVIATGNMIANAIRTGQLLSAQPTIVSMHTIKPIDTDLIKIIAKAHDTIITIEEHSIIGGLGSAVAEVLCEIGWNGKFKRCGLPDKWPRCVGRPDYLRDLYGLTPEKIALQIKSL